MTENKHALRLRLMRLDRVVAGDTAGAYSIIEEAAEEIESLSSKLDAAQQEVRKYAEWMSAKNQTLDTMRTRMGDLTSRLDSIAKLAETVTPEEDSCTAMNAILDLSRGVEASVERPTAAQLFGEMYRLHKESETVVERQVTTCGKSVVIALGNHRAGPCGLEPNHEGDCRLYA